MHIIKKCLVFLIVAVMLLTFLPPIQFTNNSDIGNRSLFGSTTVVGDVYAPTPVENLSISAGNNWVKLDWNNPSDNGGSEITHYSIYRGLISGTEILVGAEAAGSASHHSWYDNSVTSFSFYYYKVGAVNAAGETLSEEVSIYVHPAPSTPINLRVTEVNGEIILNWGAPYYGGINVVTGYRIFRRTENTSYNFNCCFASLHAKTTQFVDHYSLAHGTRYYYCIAAVNQIGMGDISYEVSIVYTQPATIPNVPYDVAVMDISGRELAIKWRTPYDGGAVISWYKIYRWDSCGNLTILFQQAFPGRIFYIFRDNSVTLEQRYYYRISAINSIGEGFQSETVSGIPHLKSPSEPHAWGWVQNGTYVILQWKGTVIGTYPLKGYIIYKKKHNEIEYHIAARVSGAHNTYRDYAVSLGVYDYLIRAEDDHGNISVASNVMTLELKDVTPPYLEVFSPPNQVVARKQIVTVTGKVGDHESGMAYLIVAGDYAAFNTDGTFSIPIRLEVGVNKVEIIASDHAGNTSVKEIEIIYIPINLSVILKIGSPIMLVNNVSQEIDPGRGTTPVIIKEWGRTVIPIRAIVEAYGGSVYWDSAQKQITITYDGKLIKLWIGSGRAMIDGEIQWIDEGNPTVMPIIINGRTMVPLRFVAETLGLKVLWIPETESIYILP